MKKIIEKNINQKLIGNSGSKLFIYFNKNYRIRKLSINKETSNRLENQFKKMVNFEKNNKYKSINIPKIFEYGFYKSNFYYDMQYINGENFSEFILRSDHKQINFLLKKILSFIKKCKIYSSKKYYDSNIVLNKINELEKKKIIKGNFNKKLFKKLKTFNWNRIPISQSHGDLSLENVLIKNDKIYFVDLSKNFVDSYYLDVSKFLFDLLSSWSFRNLYKNENNIKVISLKQNYIKFLFKYFHQYELNLIKMLTFLDFLRVLNYCKNTNHSKLLNFKLKKFYDNFNNPMLW